MTAEATRALALSFLKTAQLYISLTQTQVKQGKSEKQENNDGSTSQGYLFEGIHPTAKSTVCSINLAWMQFSDLSTINALGKNARCLLSPLNQLTQYRRLVLY